MVISVDLTEEEAVYLYDILDEARDNYSIASDELDCADEVIAVCDKLLKELKK